MHIFIDESGQGLPTSINSQYPSIFCVSALVAPNTQIKEIEEWFLSIETEIGKQIKGKELTNDLRIRILKELLKFDVFVESIAIDMSLFSTKDIEEDKSKRADYIENNPPTDHNKLLEIRRDFANRIRKTSNQLYIQSILNWSLIEFILRHSTFFFSQIRPEELGSFHWKIDPKEAGKITSYESMWTDLVLPYLQCQPPIGEYKEFDYSHLERFAIKTEGYRTASGRTLDIAKDRPISLNMIMKEHLDFPDDKFTPGLRIVDVIANTIFQVMNGRSNDDVARALGPLFFLRRPTSCITLLTFKDLPDAVINSQPYKKTLQIIQKNNRTIWQQPPLHFNSR